LRAVATGASRGAVGRRAASRFDRLLVALAALVCLVFTASLRDVSVLALALAPSLPAPPIDASFGPRDAALAVSVVDGEGRAVAGASVRVFAMRGERAYYAGEHEADDGGAARFVGLPRGEAWVLAYAAAMSRGSTRVVLDQGDRSATIKLRPAVALDVEVVDDHERPVAGAEVAVTTGDPLPTLARTDAAGRARVDRLGPPPFLVRVAALGFDPVVRTAVVPAATPLRVRLERLASFVVTVVDADDAPVAGATVLAAGPGLWPARSTTTGPEGTARIGGLRGGVYDLKARAGDRASATEVGVAAKRGEARSVRLVLAAGRRVRVLVTDGEAEDAAPVGGAAVVLAEEGLTSFPLEGRTDPKGAVVIGPVARGPATVSARAAGFVARSAVLVKPEETEVRVPLVRGGALVGDVVDDRGYPVPGASIEVVGTDLDGMPIDETSAMTDFRERHFDAALLGPAPLVPMGELGVMPGPIPDVPHGDVPVAVARATTGGEPWVTRRDGAFRAEPVPPGKVRVIVRHPGYLEAESALVALASGGEARVHVVMRTGGSIEGRVLEEDRRPVPGARVEVSAIHGSFERVTTTAEDGTFAIAAAPEEVLVSVSRREAPGDPAARLVVEVPQDARREVEVVLPKLRDPLALRVTDDRGYPLGRVEVRAASLDPAVALSRTVFTADDGQAEVPGAGGLPLRLQLTRPTNAPKIVELESAPKSLTVALDRGVLGRGRVTARDGRDRVEGAEVTVHTATGPRHAKTDAEGAYEVPDLAPGRARIEVSHAGHARAEAVRAVAGDFDHPADLGAVDLAEAGEVTGEVVDAAEAPVAGARVGRDKVPTFLPLGPLPPGIVTTDKKGRFTLAGLPEGDVRLEAYDTELGRGALDGVSVRAGRTTSRVTIVLGGGGPVAPEPKGAGSLAVTLGERSGAGGKVVVIVMVPPASEAELAGLEPGDELVAGNGRPGGSIEPARQRLSGPLSEDVVLELARDEAGGPGTPRATLHTRARRERVRR
jgi:hypothetical protein